LDGVFLDIMPGEVCCLVGPSGCGKTTLLQIAGLIDVPTSGKIFIEGMDCSNLSDNIATSIRRDKIGFIYQFHHLLGEFNAIENVMMPLLISGISYDEAYERALAVLNDFKLGARLKNIPAELSGGEQQRVAVARALIHNPRILLADEPTGNLDSKNSLIIFEEFVKLSREKNLAIVVATHNSELAKKADKILTIRHGKIGAYSD
jgi:lipoprotein-releasing system ATP-binding protein